MRDQQYDLDELDWVDPPAEYEFFGSVVYLYPDDEDRSIEFILNTALSLERLCCHQK